MNKELSGWCVPPATIQEINVTINDNGRTEDGNDPKANIVKVEIVTGDAATFADSTSGSLEVIATQRYLEDAPTISFDKVYSLYGVIQNTSTTDSINAFVVLTLAGGEAGTNDKVVIPANSFQLMITEYNDAPYGEDIFKDEDDICTT